MTVRRVQQRDIAERAGVSVSTVSRVLNDVGGVSETVRQRVLAVAAELGYEPGSAPRLRRVMLVRPWPDVSLNTFYSDVLDGVEAECRRLGGQLHYTVAEPGPAGRQRFREALKGSQADGVVLVRVDDAAWIEELLALDLNLVLINAWHPGLPVDTFLPDNVAGACLAVEHLLAHGHRRILHVTSLARPTIRQRFEAYRAALGADYDPALLFDMPGDFTMTTEGGHAHMQRFLADDPPPFTAIFCGNDDTAIGVLRAVQEAGLRVPEDVSLVGYDDLPVASFLVPPLTTVRIERRELGMLAVRRLADRVSSPGLTPIRVELATRLIVRQSVATIRP